MSTLPDGPPNRPEPPSRTTILVSALGGVAAFAVIILVLFRVLGGVNQAMNKAAEEQRERDEQNRRQLDQLFGGKQRAIHSAKEQALQDVGHADPAIRLESVTLLAKLYLDDREAIAALVKRLKVDNDPRVRLAAIRALREIRPRPDSVKVAITVAADDNDPGVRAEAEAALAEGK